MRSNRMEGDLYSKRCLNIKVSGNNQHIFILMRLLLTKLSVIVSLLLTGNAFGQQMPIPIDVQWNLFPKILQFDRNLHQRVGDEMVIGILYQERYRVSLTSKEEIISVTTSMRKIDNISVKFVPIKLIDGNFFEKSISDKGIDIIYITPLRAHDIKTIAYICCEHDILTLTGVPEYVEKCIAVGIGEKEKKPLILINKNAAREEGADFSSKLLKLSKVIGE